MYVENAEHVLDIREVALFEEFQENNPHVKIGISIFHKLKPGFIGPNTI